MGNVVGRLGRKRRGGVTVNLGLLLQAPALLYKAVPV